MCIDVLSGPLDWSRNMSGFCVPSHSGLSSCNVVNAAASIVPGLFRLCWLGRVDNPRRCPLDVCNVSPDGRPHALSPLRKSPKLSSSPHRPVAGGCTSSTFPSSIHDLRGSALAATSIQGCFLARLVLVIGRPDPHIRAWNFHINIEVARTTLPQA